MALKALTPEKQLAPFIDKFTPEMAKRIRAARAKMRKLIPQAVEMVYDNYNFFVIGYGPSNKAGDAIFSLASQTKGISLCFLKGAKLPDPKRLLRGLGSVVRSIRLGENTLDDPDLEGLIALALARAKTPLSPSSKHQLIIKSVSVKQRPRRSA